MLAFAYRPSVVGATAHVLIAASFFIHSGFFSLEGGVIVAIPATMFVWLVATSGALLREGAEVGPAAP